MKILSFVITLATVIVAANAQAQVPNDLVGCWRVKSLVIDPSGTNTEPFGTEPTGQLLFTADGHMSSIVMRRDLPAEWQATGDRITTTLITYFGSYELKGNALTIKVDGSSRVDWRGQTLTRAVDITPKKELVFKTEAPSVPSRITLGPCQAS
jgi:hypothetical protein